MCHFSFSETGKVMNQHREDGEYSSRSSQPVATPGLRDVHTAHTRGGTAPSRVRGGRLARRQPAAGPRSEHRGLAAGAQRPCTKARVKESLTARAGAPLLSGGLFFFI